MNPCIIPLLCCLCNRNIPQRRRLNCCCMPVFKVIKKDADSGELLAGSVFHLDSQKFPTESAMTEQDGTVSFTLSAGVRYILYEAEAPKNYERDLRRFIIYANGSGRIFVNGRCLDTLTVASHISIYATSFTSNTTVPKEEKTLEGVCFQLRSKGQIVAESVSDQLGRVAFYDLPPGEYLLYEVKAWKSEVDIAEPYLIYVYPNGSVVVNGEDNSSYKVFYDKPIELKFLRSAT